MTRLLGWDDCGQRFRFKPKTRKRNAARTGTEDRQRLAERFATGRHLNGGLLAWSKRTVGELRNVSSPLASTRILRRFWGHFIEIRPEIVAMQSCRHRDVGGEGQSVVQDHVFAVRSRVRLAKRCGPRLSATRNLCDWSASSRPLQFAPLKGMRRSAGRAGRLARRRPEAQGTGLSSATDEEGAAFPPSFRTGRRPSGAPCRPGCQKNRCRA